jgi:hypothetical protein
MTKLQRLQAQARMSAENRGHTLAPFSLLAPGNAVSKCTVCNREVQVLTKPAPNQIDVGGEAVALRCTADDMLRKPSRAMQRQMRRLESALFASL